MEGLYKCLFINVLKYVAIKIGPLHKQFTREKLILHVFSYITSKHIQKKDKITKMNLLIYNQNGRPSLN